MTILQMQRLIKINQQVIRSSNSPWTVHNAKADIRYYKAMIKAKLLKVNAILRGEINE